MADTPLHDPTAMHGRDEVSRWLGLHLVGVGSGTAEVTMEVTEEHLNGHGSCHGGVLFTLADTAFANACNSHGPVAVAASTSIEFLAPVAAGDRLLAVASERLLEGRTGFYDVEVRRGDDVVALFRGRSRVINS